MAWPIFMYFFYIHSFYTRVKLELWYPANFNLLIKSVQLDGMTAYTFYILIIVKLTKISKIIGVTHINTLRLENYKTYKRKAGSLATLNLLAVLRPARLASTLATLILPRNVAPTPSHTACNLWHSTQDAP